MRVKTCLRYPGGKFYGFKFISNLLKTSHEEYREPFLGGGSVFLSKNLANRNWLNDLDKELINFYEIISNNSYRQKLFKMLENEYVDKDRYKEIINYKPENNIQRAFRYFFLNRTSFSGIMYKPRWGYRLGSSVTPDKWVKRIIPVADKIQKAKITCLDYKEIIDKDKNDILYYLDPPYYDASRNIYNNEFRNEDHLDLCTLLKDINGKFVLSYNNHEYIKKIYDWANIKSEEWIYFLSENRRNQGKELIITNF